MLVRVYSRLRVLISDYKTKKRKEYKPTSFGTCQIYIVSIYFCLFVCCMNIELDLQSKKLARNISVFFLFLVASTWKMQIQRHRRSLYQWGKTNVEWKRFIPKLKRTDINASQIFISQSRRLWSSVKPTVNTTATFWTFTAMMVCQCKYTDIYILKTINE